VSARRPGGLLTSVNFIFNCVAAREVVDALLSLLQYVREYGVVRSAVANALGQLMDGGVRVFRDVAGYRVIRVA